MSDKIWRIRRSHGAVIAVANHNGHELRPELAALSALDDASRLREEDPFTGEWAEAVPTSLVAERSRFEVDLNRPRETAVYMTPDDAWGLELWKSTPAQTVIDVSLSEYDAYYGALESLCREKQQRHGAFVVLDLHSYNHRRDGPSGAEADPAGNPEVNIGTGTMDRQRWGGLVDRFIQELRAFEFLGRHLDVREKRQVRRQAVSQVGAYTISGDGVRDCRRVQKVLQFSAGLSWVSPGGSFVSSEAGFPSVYSDGLCQACIHRSTYSVISSSFSRPVDTASSLQLAMAVFTDGSAFAELDMTSIIIMPNV